MSLTWERSELTQELTAPTKDGRYIVTQDGDSYKAVFADETGPHTLTNGRKAGKTEAVALCERYHITLSAPVEPKPRLGYCIVAGSTAEEVITDVKAQISKGWLPLGGISIDETHIVQAMTRTAREGE